MCTKEHWERCNASEAYYVANKFATELEEYAKTTGHNSKSIRIRNKEQIIRSGLGKADAQVVWEDGPKDWALEFAPENDMLVSSITEDKNTVSFYLT